MGNPGAPGGTRKGLGGTNEEPGGNGQQRSCKAKSLGKPISLWGPQISGRTPPTVDPAVVGLMFLAKKDIVLHAKFDLSRHRTEEASPVCIEM